MLVVQKMLFIIGISLLSTLSWAKYSYSIKTSNPALSSILNKSLSIKSTESTQDIETKVKSFLIKNGYYTASIKIKDRTIEVTNPTKWNLFFEGNTFYSRHFLKKSLASSAFSTVPETLIPELEQSLVKTYKTAGFHFVKVKASLIENQKKFQSQLVFKITEYEIVKLKKISISGDFGTLKKKDLLKRLRRYSGEQVSKDIYYDNALTSGLASLKNDLNNLGFFNAYVGIEDLKFNLQKNRVSAKIKIYVNSPTTLSSVVFKGNNEVSEFWLNELLNLKKGDTLDLYALEAGLDLIEDYYLQRGFLRVQVQMNKEDILSYSPDLKFAKLNVTIQENPQVLVSNIKIQGNLKTKKSIILREITFKPGEILTIDKIKSSKEHLTKLGFFSNIRFNIRFREQSEKGTPVEIILSERKSGAFTTGFGINSELELTVKVFAGLEYKNINGTGRAFSTRAELKQNLRQIDYLENRVFGSYLEPYLLESDFKGRINLSRNDEIWDISSDRNSFTVIESNRLDFILERSLTEHTTLFLNPFSLDIRRENVITDNDNDTSEEIQEVISSIGPSIEIDYRNNPYLPTKGSLSKIQIEYASPFLGSNTKSKKDVNGDEFEKVDLEYLKVQSSYTFYKPFSKSLIWAQSFRGGYLHNYSDKKSNGFTPFPKSRAFFLGGATTVRGFAPSQANERIPDDGYLETNGGILSGSTIGGGVLNIPRSSYYYLSKTELRFPLSKNSSWWGSVFYDGGSVQITSLGENYDPWRHSIGVGVRFNTPVGPLLNAEIAYKLDRKTENDESAIQFHLSVSSF